LTSRSARRRFALNPWMVGLTIAGVVAAAGITVAGAAAAAGTTRTTASASAVTTQSAPGNLLQRAGHVYGSAASDWTPDYATVTDVSTPAPPTGAGSTLAVASTGSGYAVATLGGATGGIAAAGGQVYTAATSVQASGTSRRVAPYLIFFSATGTELARVGGQSVSDAVGSWTQLEPVVGIAPTGTASAALRLVWQVPVGETHFVAEPSLTTRTSGSRTVVGPLHTSGNKLYDANGPLVLRGLHRFGFEGSVRHLGIPNNFTPIEISRAKEWGANVIRLSLASSFWLGTSCHFDPTYATRVDQAVQWITGAGMVALVDYHWNSITDCSPVGGQLMADRRGPAFLTALAKRYKGNPLVAFDLYNEPHDISDSVWLHGGWVTSGGTAWQATGMQTLYDAVRSAGANNVVVVSGNSWGNKLPSVRVRGTNIVYGVHAYTCPHAPFADDCRVNPLDPSSILGSWVTPSARVPVMVTEFGWPAKNDGRYNRNVIRYAEAHGWGWQAFAWDGGTQGTFDLLADVTTHYEPNASGMPVADGLKRNG